MERLWREERDKTKKLTWRGPCQVRVDSREDVAIAILGHRPAMIPVRNGNKQS